MDGHSIYLLQHMIKHMQNGDYFRYGHPY